MDGYGVDRWIWPVEVDGDANTIVVYDPSIDDTLTVELDAGRYYQYSGARLSTDWEPLLQTIVDELNLAMDDAGGAGDYTVEAHTPAGSDLTNSGLRIVKEGGGAAFELRFSDGDWSLDTRLLGFAEGHDTDEVATVDGDASAVEAPLSLWGVWQSYTLFADNAATSKLRDHNVVLESSSQDDPLDSFDYTRKSWVERTIEYPRVPALHVFEDADQRGESAKHRSNAGLPEGDTHNAVYSMWWHAGRKKRDMLIVHDVGDEGLTIPDGQWEAVVLRETSQRSLFSELYSTARRKGESYDIELEIAVREGEYTY